MGLYILKKIKPMAFELNFNGKKYFFTRGFYKKNEAEKFAKEHCKEIYGLARIVKRKHNGRTIYRVYARRKK